MNLNAETEEELFLCFAEGYEDGITDNESETITLNRNRSFYVRRYTNLVQWNKSLAPHYGKPLTSDTEYRIPRYAAMLKSKERSKSEHL